MTSLITNDFIAFARDRFRLDWTGIHGAPHWGRVRHNGLLLAEHYNVDTAVIQWFAFLHDLERHDDWEDPLHGHRAATLAAEINAHFMGLSEAQMGLLQAACREHSDGKTEADATVMVCWDADRLDLGRVGIFPDPRYLCTSFSRQAHVISSAHDRSVPGCNQADSESLLPLDEDAWDDCEDHLEAPDQKGYASDMSACCLTNNQHGYDET